MSQDSINTIAEDGFETLSYFEFKRIRAANIKSDNKEIDNNNNFIYKIPTRRSGHRAVCNEENLWIWGGYNPVDVENVPENLLPELYRFNFITKKWQLLKTIGNIPNYTVASPAVLLYKNSIICLGGTGCPFGDVLDDSLYICNLKTLEWKKYNIIGQKPEAMYGSSIFIYENFLYVMFGTNSRQYVSNVYRINIETLVSECLFNSKKILENANFREIIELNKIYPDDFLSGRYRQEVILFEKNVFVFGGGKKEGDSLPLNKLPVFNLENNEWKFIDTQPDENTKEYPEHRKFHSCVKIDNYCYVFGGLYFLEYSCKSVENCVWRINLVDLKWEKLDIKMPINSYFHATCSNDEGTVYIHGGVKEISEEYDPKRINHLYSIQLKIPKLQEICWKFITENFKNLIKLKKNVLLKAGINIPENFLNRMYS